MKPGDVLGDGRYVLRRTLGAGGMGVVFEAWDGERQAPVALKTLARLDALAVARLKREFRVLAEVTHEHLVALHDLVLSDAVPFFTMDLVQGVDFLRFVRGNVPPREAQTASCLPFDWYVDDAPVWPRAKREGAIGFDEGRLRSALLQLARALEALHAAGIVHSDLKPTNVLVAPTGHLTVLDFGLARSVGLGATESTLELVAGGTPAYMSPEQAAGEPVTRATDLYGLGVMLYEALTGVLPFGGNAVQMLTAKLLAEPRPPADLVAGLPSDLARCCVELLRRDATRRPTATDLIRRWQGASPRGRERGPARRARSEDPEAEALLGRSAELARLERAQALVAQGRPVFVRVHGPAGVGKTFLVRHFLRSIRARAVVLAGRCHERETMAYKALDSGVEALARYLRSLSEAEVAALLPRDADVLARVFPVLERVPAVRAWPRRAGDGVDPQRLRHRAFVALRELMARIADRRPLVVFIDDVQWGDVDSAEALAEILRPPDAPACLIVVAYRSEDVGTSPLLSSFSARPWLASGVVVEDIVVGGLGAEHGRQLARRLAGRRARAAWLDEVVAVSGGNAFLIRELALGLREGAPRRTGSVSILSVLRDRLAPLPVEARTLLEVIAVAGGPVPVTVASRAAELGDRAARAMLALGAARVTRTTWAYGGLALDVYHDRFRALILEGLNASVRGALHARLAAALEHHGGVEPDRIALHWEAAGDLGRAREYVLRSAERGMRLLAFDRAAQLYAKALSLEANERPELVAAWAQALAGAGRSAEAAEAFALAARAARGAEAWDWQRMAAEHWLRSGHLTEGLEAMRHALRRVGLDLYPTPAAAARALAQYRRQAHRATRRTVPARALPLERERMHACWSAAVGLGMVDLVQGAAFQARHLWYAQRTGDGSHRARAMALDVAHRASAEPGARARLLSSLEEAEALARAADDDHARSLVFFARGSLALFSARWREAAGWTERAERLLVEHPSTMAWELAVVRRFHLVARFYLGQLDVVRQRVLEHLAEATARDDHLAASCCGSGSSLFAWLVPGDVAGARARVDEERSRWRGRHPFFQRYLALQALCYLCCYEGRFGEALKALQSAWEGLEEARVLRVALLRATMLYLRGACAAAHGSTAAVQLARQDLQALGAAHIASGPALACIVDAQLALHAGNRRQALRCLEIAERRLQGLNMEALAAAVRRHRGSLLGGREGYALVDAADARLAALGARDPERLVRALVPFRFEARGRSL